MQRLDFFLAGRKCESCTFGSTGIVFYEVTHQRDQTYPKTRKNTNDLFTTRTPVASLGEKGTGRSPYRIMHKG